MNTRRIVTSLGASTVLVVSMSAARFGAAPAEMEACSLLTAANASAAIEVPSGPGKRITESDPKGCVWSGPGDPDTSRHVTLVLVNVRQYQMAYQSKAPGFTAEPVSGVGDEAFYQLLPKNNTEPLIWVHKGTGAISIRVITVQKPSPFTIDQVKAKELALAKAAVAKL